MERMSLWTMMVMTFHLQISAGLFCENNIFLRDGRRGVVSCDFGVYEIVGWLYTTEKLETTRPFIYLENSEIRGPESNNRKYSILPNGSLVIEHVNISHEKNYTARIVKNNSVFHLEVPVKVYVIPNPEHPVVNGRTDQDRVIVHTSSGSASFNCTMDHIRPTVPLELSFISSIENSISVTTIPSLLNNHDGTYNVSLDVQLTGINLPNGIYFLECGVAERFAHLFASVSRIDLRVFDGLYKFPLVNGLDNQQHVVLDVNRSGTINCSMNRVSGNIYLEWAYINHYPLAAEEQRHLSVDNEDGTYNITSIISYNTARVPIQCVTLKCMVSNDGPYMNSLFTTVELRFPALERRYKFPSVNGSVNKQHVVMNVNREGTLSCSMITRSPNVNLGWSYINHYSSSEVALERQTNSSLDNGDGTYNITSISRYKTTSNSVQFVTLMCVPLEKLADMYPLYTTVELHFPATDSDNSCNCTACVLLLILSGIMNLIFWICYCVARKRIQRKTKRLQVMRIEEKLHNVEVIMARIEKNHDKEKMSHESEGWLKVNRNGTIKNTLLRNSKRKMTTA